MTRPSMRGSCSKPARRIERIALRFFRLLLACGLFVVVLGAGFAARPAGRIATVAGYVQFCGGPPPGGCHKGVVGFCRPPEGCVTSDRVAAINAHGRRVATEELDHASFRLHLVPGRYTIELLGDGKRVHGRVLQRKKVRARTNRTTLVIFSFPVP